MDEQLVRVGSDRFMAIESVVVPPTIRNCQEACHAKGHSLVMVAVGGEVAGAIELQPTIRPEARAVIDALQKRTSRW